MKRIIAIAILAFMVLLLASCASYSSAYKTAIIKFPNGEVITITLEEWSWCSSNDSVTIKCTDGAIYRTAWQNVILIGEAEE